MLSRDRDNKHVQEQTELSLCICHAFLKASVSLAWNMESQTGGYHYKTIQYPPYPTGSKNSDFHKKIFPSYNNNFDNSSI